MDAVASDIRIGMNVTVELFQMKTRGLGKGKNQMRWDHFIRKRNVDLLNRTLVVTLVALASILGLFALLMENAAATAVLICLWGVASFALVPPLQVKVIAIAADAPGLAASVNVGAFNLGNAIGASLGGAVIGAGLGYPVVALAAAAVAATTLILVMVAFGQDREAGDRRDRTGEQLLTPIRNLTRLQRRF